MTKLVLRDPAEIVREFKGLQPGDRVRLSIPAYQDERAVLLKVYEREDTISGGPRLWADVRLCRDTIGPPISLGLEWLEPCPW